jgi:glycosyltransferase involved in cell wall biosynthesis
MEQDRPLVSVIIPTHNRSSLLCEALASVMEQEGRGELFELETIVVDDASTDDTRRVAAEYPVRYIRHPTNLGLSAARNSGIAEARGRYVAFLDDDDLWLPHRLQVQLPVMEAHPEVDLVYSTYLARLDGTPLPFDGSPGRRATCLTGCSWTISWAMC